MSLPQLEGFEEAMKRNVDSPSSYPYNVQESKKAHDPKRKNLVRYSPLTKIKMLMVDLRASNASLIALEVLKIIEEMENANGKRHNT